MAKYKAVMVIDDNEMDLMLNEMVLKTSGVTNNVIKKPSVEKAISFIRENQEDTDTLPALILLDLNMPQKSGFDFLEEFNQMNAEVKKKCRIAVISSSEDYADMEKINTYPYVIRYLIKPLEIDTIIDL